MKEDTDCGPGVVLAKIFRKFLYILNIDINKYQHLILVMVRKLLINNNNKMFNFTSMLGEEIFSPSTTWRTFIKSLVFLGTKRFTMSIRANDDGPISICEVSLTDSNMIRSLFSFTEPDTKVESTGTYLRHLLDAVLADNGLDMDYSTVINDYVKKSRSSSYPVTKSFKGNLIKELRSDSITWKVFIKVLVVYGVTEPIVGVVIYDRFGKEYAVNLQVTLEAAILQ